MCQNKIFDNTGPGNALDAQTAYLMLILILLKIICGYTNMLMALTFLPLLNKAVGLNAVFDLLCIAF